ncbi:S1 family peptidase [Phytohabitans sp. LJ34]|uniref:S1 family peptidase n=1 Tax=Phytohabitans sp. LJ34 TaxID=3452217 RepID=UPI003F8C7390
MRFVFRQVWMAGLLAWVVAVVGALTPAPAFGIAGGTAAAQGAYDFVADVKIGDVRGCSGVLIDPEWIVTAASCFGEAGQPVPSGPPAQPTTVTVGRADLLVGSGGQVRTVIDIVPRTDRDVALARLAKPVIDVAPAKIGTTAPAVGDVLRVAGFGRTATEWVPDRLSTAPFTVQGTTSTTVDIAGTGAAPPGVCRGDAGGPALREVAGGVEVVALSSTTWQGGCFNETETRNGATEVRLDDIKPWIQQAIRGGDFVRLATSASVLDTRIGLGAPAGLRAGGSVTSFQVTGVGGVPATGVRAVLVDVTAVQPVNATYLTLFPEGTSRPIPLSMVNTAPGQVISNTAVVPLRAGGKLSVYNASGNTHITVDVQGYYTAPFGTTGGGFVPVAHSRLVDTRTSGGALPSGASRTFTLTGGAVPAGAAAVFLDVIVTGSTGHGWLGARAPTDGEKSVMDYLPGTFAHGLAVRLDSAGRATFTNHGGSSIHLVLTAEGYYTASQTTGWGLRAMAGTRVLDTRLSPGAPVAANAVVDVPLSVPAGSAAVLNLTVVNNTAGGFLRAWPAGAAEPVPSLVNYPDPATSARSGLAVVQVGTGGTVRIKNTSPGTAHILADLQAWFAPPIQ